VVVDGRNFLDPEAMREAGIIYEGIGRGTARPLSRQPGSLADETA
jgi:hypothetical protein